MLVACGKTIGRFAMHVQFGFFIVLPLQSLQNQQKICRNTACACACLSLLIIPSRLHLQALSDGTVYDMRIGVHSFQKPLCMFK